MSQFATFNVGDQLFGLGILDIREIIRAYEITPVPRTEGHIRGLINLRGQIVTILELAVRLGRPSRPITESSHIIILKAGVEVPKDERTQGATRGLLGLLVDSIGDVVAADAGRAEAPPANIADDEDRFVSGVLNTEAGLLVLLNLQELLSTG